MTKTENLPPKKTDIIVLPSPMSLLQIAVQDGADIEKLEKLMALQERWEAKEAEKAFHVAMGGFQFNCPEIKATKNVSFGQTNYDYAPLPTIESSIKQPMFDAKLTKRWEVDDKGGGDIVVTCIITHKKGHKESTTMSAPPDSSGGKNTIQQRLSTVQYLMRRTLICSLGITTADKDDDGIASGKKATTEKKLPELKPGHPKWDDAKAAIINGTVTLQQIRKKYILTEENSLELCSI